MRRQGALRQVKTVTNKVVLPSPLAITDTTETDKCEESIITIPTVIKKDIEKDDESRHQMLMKQLPPHDFDPEYCYGLSEVEKEELIQFAKQLQERSVGKGILKQNHMESDLVRKTYILIPNSYFYDSCGPSQLALSYFKIK